jgi:hypothetical protein
MECACQLRGTGIATEHFPCQAGFGTGFAALRALFHVEHFHRARNVPRIWHGFCYASILRAKRDSARRLLTLAWHASCLDYLRAFARSPCAYSHCQLHSDRMTQYSAKRRPEFRRNLVLLSAARTRHDRARRAMRKALRNYQDTWRDAKVAAYIYRVQKITTYGPTTT